MKIEICENNAVISQDGKPTLVIVLVTTSGGKQYRFPYHAERTIQELCKDMAKIVEEPVSPSPVAIPSSELTPPEESSSHRSADSKEKIEREDIVECIRLEKDLDGNTNEELEIGRHYRVIDIIKMNGAIIGYEVLDDEKNDKIRISVFSTEVMLVKKFIPPPPRRMVFDTTKQCELCGSLNALFLEGNEYVGKCDKCGAVLRMERPQSAAKT